MDTGISTLVDLDLPIVELSQMIAQAGFTHISLSHDIEHAGYHLPSEREHLRQLWDGLGLKLDYIHPPLECFHDVTSPDPQVRRATNELMKLALNATAELGGNSITLHVANDREIDKEQFDCRVEAGLESIRELSEYASKLDVVLCIENLAGTTDAGRLSLEIIHATTDWEALKVCFDSCHLTMGNDDPKQLLHELAPRVHTTHLSDTMGESDSHLIPGEGNVDFALIARELGQAGFAGVVDLECSLWMLRRRHNRQQTHPDDPVPCSTEHYLERAHSAALRIGQQIEEARDERGRS